MTLSVRIESVKDDWASIWVVSTEDETEIQFGVFVSELKDGIAFRLIAQHGDKNDVLADIKAPMAAYKRPV